MISPTIIKWVLIAAFIAALAAAGVAVVSAYNSAIESAQLAKEKNQQLRDSLSDRDAALASWAERQKEWEAERMEHAKASAQKDKEAEAAMKRFTKAIEDYRNAIKTLPDADRDCAMRPVPAVVDKLLNKSEESQANVAR